MNKRILKKLVIFLIILLLIISVAIIIIAKSYLKTQNNNATEEDGENVAEDYGTSAKGGVDEQSYFDIKSCMEKYLDALNENKSVVYVPLEASLLNNSDIKSFIVHGLIQNEDDYSIIDEIFAVVNINIMGCTFSVEPIDGDYNSINEIKINQFEENIPSNGDNEFYMSYITVEDIPAEYMNLYRRLALGAPEKMYNLLDEQYREAKFGSLDGFKNYVETNKSNIRNIRLKKYQVTIYDDYLRYICIDQNDNYYIFKQNVVLQDYTVMLDIYTADIEEFTEKYNSSSENEKVILNMQKIATAIKNGDYKYAYSKLDDTFKANKFKTQETFENYTKKNFSADDKISYNSFEKINDLCIYNATITRGNKTVSIKIVMQLKEGTDFVMSFSISK